MYLLKPNQSGKSTPYRRNHLLRSVGAELLALLFRSSPTESPKPVVQTSPGVVLSGPAVHILLILASIAIIAINLKNIYCGRTLTGSILDPAINIALLQVNAKIFELLVIASLTTIVAHRIRQEMLYGEGVPLGLVGGAFLFSSLSYFWSPDFCGSFQHRSSQRRKVRLYGTIILCGFLAASVGPSAAVLLIPRDQPFSAGGAAVYIRGSVEEVWPKQMDFSTSGIEPFCALPNATEYAMCPSGGCAAMVDYSKTRFLLNNYVDLQQNLSSFQFDPRSLSIQTTHQSMPNIILSGNWRSYACETSMSGIHTATAIFLSKLLDGWYMTAMSIPYRELTSTISQYKYFGVLSTTANSWVPTVRVACSDAQNISATNNLIQFPVMPEFGCWSSTNQFEYSMLSRTSSQNIRTSWVSLPKKFGAVSTGLVLEAPWTANGESRVILGCSIDARWTTGDVASQDVGDSYVPSNFAGNPTNLAATDDRHSEFRPKNDSSWIRIELQPS
ncbi:MAG: hypothetical protein MMC33_003147 [Icmadophila ericetorum]|nr:hypothetical protein [Icmadophila ericetorum]